MCAPCDKKSKREFLTFESMVERQRKLNKKSTRSLLARWGKKRTRMTRK